MEVLHVQDPSQLDELEHLTHDRPFRLSWLKYDAGNRRLSLTVGVESPFDLPFRWWHLFFWRVKVPLIEHVLEFHHVQSYSVDDRSNIEQYTFRSVAYDESTGGLTVKTHQALTIFMTIDKLDIIVSDHGRQIGTRTAYGILICDGEFDRLLDRGDERESSD